jgi:molecular chaperone GrpE
MNDTPEDNIPDEDPLKSDQDIGAAADEEAQAPKAELSAEELQAARIGELEGEVKDLKDRLLRAVAETENLRRRSEREKKDASQYAVTGFARDILSISDTLSRTMAAVTDELKATETFKPFIEGVDMAEREVLAVFERQGIKKIIPDGEKFDHNFHQAMFEIENPDVPAGTILQVIQPGYVLKDRLLSPAMVGVAKGGKKDGKNKEAEVDTKA